MARQNKTRKKYTFYLGLFAGGAVGSILGSTLLTATVAPLSGLLTLLGYSLAGLIAGSAVGAVSGVAAMLYDRAEGPVIEGIEPKAEWLAAGIAVIGILGALVGNGLATGYAARELIARESPPKVEGVPEDFTCPVTNRAWIGSGLGAALGAGGAFFLLRNLRKPEDEPRI